MSGVLISMRIIQDLARKHADKAEQERKDRQTRKERKQDKMTKRKSYYT